MAITASVGYSGTVDYGTYSQTVTQGARYTVDSPAAWKVSAIAGDRTVRVAAGDGQGFGIRDTATNTNLQHATVASGVRHDLIVCRRNWSTGVSQFMIIPGGSNPVLPARSSGPGVIDDQPLALVRITANSTVPVVVADLRCWAGDGGLVAVDALALDYLEETPGTRVTIGSKTYTRVLSAAGAASWDVNDSATGLGVRPSLLIARSSLYTQSVGEGWLVGASSANTAEYGDLAARGMSASMGSGQSDPARLVLGQAGLYAFGFRVAVASSAAQRFTANLGIFSGSPLAPALTVPPAEIDYPGDSEEMWLSMTDTRWLRGAATVGVRLDAEDAAVSVRSWALWATWLGN